MPLVEIKDCNALIDNKPFFDQPVKNKQEAYEKLIDYTTIKTIKMMFIEQEIYQNICMIKIIINLLVQIYQDKQIQIFLNKLILQEKQKKMMVEQCFLLLKSSKKLF